MLTRRKLLRGAGYAGLAGLAARSALMPGWAQSPSGLAAAIGNELTGTEIDLTIGATPLSVDGRMGTANTINGTVPGPLLRLREGDTVTLNVTNALPQTTSIHWHGIILPNAMDGVPKVTFDGIAPGTTFKYRYTLQQNGTYWYHSHSGFQEQKGVYGPMIVEPADGEPQPFDREHVVVLSDWTFGDPHRILGNLKRRADYYNRQKRTLIDFFKDVEDVGFDAALADRMDWGAMRMDPTDISDVTAAAYTYLINGMGPDSNWTGLFRPGERVRLRFINAAAMSIFNVRIPGLRMTVIQADGQNVRPVTIDEFQIGAAETFDVIVTPEEDRAYTLMAETNDRSGYGRGTLAPRPGMSAPVPELRERPLSTMKDMGMDHDAMDHGGMDHGGMDHSTMDHNTMDQGAMDQDAMDQDGVDHAAMGHTAPAAGTVPTSRRNFDPGPGVANIAEMPSNRLAEAPAGLSDVPHKVLTYADLRSLEPTPDTRAPMREVELHLTGNMERYIWSFDGKKFSKADGPIMFRYGERVRFTMVNNTMMPHPIHLHGLWMDLDVGAAPHNPRKHTIVVKPGERLSTDITVDAPGDWALHCHLLMHMEAGMFQVVRVPAETVSAT